jgi:uncharacterized protein (TIGR03663 family)
MAIGDDSARGVDGVTLGVVALTGAALLLRLVGLGERPFHWDEARVGYWTLRFATTGAFEYRPVAGGPFLYVVDRHLFAAFAPADALARLPVALIGGALPLSALLFRGRLRDDETVVFAAILAASPLLVYYSRFLRGDVPLAAFALVAVGLALRGLDTDDRRLLYGAGLAVGLALTTSGFVVGTLACWLLAGWLMFDHAGLIGAGAAGGGVSDDDPAENAPGGGSARDASGEGDSPDDAPRDARSDGGSFADSSGTPAVERNPDERARAAAERLRALATPLARSGLLAFAVVVFFYAPRAGSGDGPGLWRPGTWPVVFESVVVGSVRKFFGVRVASRRHGGTHALLPFLRDNVELLAFAALPVVSLAGLAFVADRYGPGEPRSVVAFHAYWAGAALLIFPAITEVSAPWVAVHALVPLAVPAAVGGASLLRFARRASARGDAASVGAVLLVLAAVAAQVGAVTAGDVYGPSDRDNRLAQFAQPAADLDALAANLSAVVSENDGVDVLYYGERFHTLPAMTDGPPANDDWGHRLPLPWYFERIGARTDSVETEAQLADRERLPPVVVADASDRSELAPRLEGYEAAEYRLGLWNRRVVVFVRE